jgi:hypothetical protein
MARLCNGFEVRANRREIRNRPPEANRIYVFKNQGVAFEIRE